MSNTENILLVEGESDKSFFEEVCKSLNIAAKINIAPPRAIGGLHNSKQGMLQYLPTLVQQLSDGQLTHLAVIMDADYKNEHGLGYQATVDQMACILSPLGFSLKKTNPPNAGIFFQHSDGLSDIGLWVMPNNRDEGMLEDWIKRCISAEEQVLFQHAEKIIAGLSAPKFKEIHRAKAEVATWLAWQKHPGHGAYFALQNKCIDSECEQFKQLENWLKQVYQ